MKIRILKYYNHFISILLIIGFVLEIFIKHHLDNDGFKLIIDYYFWFTLGLFSGVFLTGIIHKKYKF
jgi:hypothetical protein